MAKPSSTAPSAEESDDVSSSSFDSGSGSESPFDSGSEEEEEDGSSSEEEDGFEDQGSSDEDDDDNDALRKARAQVSVQDSDESDDEELQVLEQHYMGKALEKESQDSQESQESQESEKKNSNNMEKQYPSSHVRALTLNRGLELERNKELSSERNKKLDTLHIDDLSSDDEDEEGKGNKTGKVPLHWYDSFDHVGYTLDGGKKKRGASGAEKGEDLLDRAIRGEDGSNRWTIRDELNDEEITLSPEQIEMLRRIQSGAYAHKEHDANPDYIDYFSGVDKQISSLQSGTVPKSQFLTEVGRTGWGKRENGSEDVVTTYF